MLLKVIYVDFLEKSGKIFFRGQCGDSMKEEMQKYWSEFKSGTKLMFNEFLDKKTNKKQRANMWTFSRLVNSFLIPICSILSILTANFSLFIVSIGITIFSASTDFFDGRSARKHNSFSEYGKLLDQVSDKVFSIMVGINLALFNPLFLLNLLGESIIAGINISYKLKYQNIDIKSTQIGRIKQWPLSAALILGFISLLIPNLTTATNILVVITFLLQLTTAISYIENNNSIKKLKMKKINALIEELDNNENEKVKTKIIENNNVMEENKDISRLEQCENLRNLKNELINNEIDTSLLDENNYQKIKNDYF